MSDKIRNEVVDKAKSIPVDVKILINLHPMDLLNDALYKQEAALSSIASRIILEITERVSLNQISNLQERLNSLRSLGFSLAIDNLGAGYSGLSAFPMIQPNLAKIDMSLTRNIHQDPIKLRLIQALLKVCTKLNMPIVIEGVETPQERDTLIAIGCKLLQGYLFGKPMPEIIPPTF